MSKYPLGAPKLPPKIISPYRRKTILITGAQGYIGSALAHGLTQIDCQLLLVDKLSQTSWLPKNNQARISFFKADTSTPKTWKTILPQVDYLFHLAGLEYNRFQYNIMEDFKTNALSVFYLLETCHKYAFHPKIIFSSSANLFGKVKTLPVDEKTPSHPISPWSSHKLLAENYLYIYAQNYGIKSISLRLTNSYGPTANKKARNNVVINKVINQSLAGKPLILYSNKNCIRDYIFLDDVVRAFLYAGSQKLTFNGQFYVVGSGEGRKIADAWKFIAQKVKIQTGKKVPVKIDNSVKLEPFDNRNFIADTTMFSQATGWKPQICFKDGIKLTVNALISINKNK